MCGIAGYVAAQPIEHKLDFNKVLNEMNHRGPDDQGVHQIGNTTFGFKRLAILDLSQFGHQPMVSDDGKVVLVFNGEIYNYQKLYNQLKKYFQFKSSSDTEVILKGYLKWGWDKMLKSISGMFAISIWDSRTQTYYAARDRFGKKPFYYTLTNQCFYFASTLNTLKKLTNKSWAESSTESS